MGALWGINRSMARVHALLLVSDEPVDLGQVAERLQISRGNASMSLRELRNWGVIRRVHQSADRRDYYVPEPDPWTLFFKIAVERKKREFDPALVALRGLLADAPLGEEGPARQRLVAMEGLLSNVNRLVTRGLEDEGRARGLFEFLASTVGR